MPRRTDRAGQAGFTLVEVMTVVAIIAILVTLASVSAGGQQDPRQSATRLSMRVRECTRLAVSGGPVRSEVAAALGSRARARLVVTEEDDRQLVSVELLEEEDPPSTGAAWAPVSWSLVPRSVRIAGHLPSAQLDEDLGPGDPLPTELVVRCYPNGTTDPMTIFVDWDGAEWRRARLVVMPMTGEPIVLANW
ncbi:MAG TPA: type II secretion system protein [Kofleriaceae bacterium]|nr:type II secretion system protein [Kofleriaceae bacterium]